MRARGGWCRRGARPGAAGALTLAVAVLLAGCGGSGSLSRRQFVTRANGACHRANAKVSALPRPAAGLGGVADYARELQPIASRLATDLGQLEPPRAVQKDFRRYVDELHAGVSKLSALRAAARSGDAGEVERLSGAIGSRPTDGIATRLGLGECAKHPTPQGG